MSKHVFILSAGPSETGRVNGCLRLAKSAAEEGHEVVLMLMDDAVYLSTLDLIKNVVSPTGDKSAEHLDVLLQKKVEVVLCPQCVATRKIAPASFPEGWRLEKPHYAIKLVEAGARQWVF